MKKQWKQVLAGGAAGAINGLFGGGGGMLLLPLLRRWIKLPERKAYPTCVAIIFPACLCSAAVYFLRGQLPLKEALPYLLGGIVGGLVGGKTYGKLPLTWLRYLFAGFLFYGAVRYLL